MSFGYAMHVVCGRIGSVREKKFRDRVFLQISVASRLFPAKPGQDSVIWYQMNIFNGRDIENFHKLGLGKGDKFAFSSSDISSAVFQDRRGEYHSTLKGAVDMFWDVRDSPRPEERPDARRTPSPQRESPRASDESAPGYREEFSFERWREGLSPPAGAPQLEMFPEEPKLGEETGDGDYPRGKPDEPEPFSVEETNQALKELEAIFDSHVISRGPKPGM
ncbi:MAG: hypothetical protein LBO66_09520 [Deltaproteobacteria bacterium]|jgi:hypothetical protein|nr:hypothetical protein [Deltaproteobacteria bacterium]